MAIAETNRIREYQVKALSGDGVEFQAVLTRMTRYLAVFEIYNAALVLRVSEALTDFQIILSGRTVYLGRAILRNQINDDSRMICEVTLDEGSWKDVEFSPELFLNGRLHEQFREFIRGWQELYRVLPEYKLVIADLQSFLSDLRLSLDQVELGMNSMPVETRRVLENKVALELGKSAAPMCSMLFEKFESVAQTIQPESLPAHQTYARRQLHPLVSGSPFFYRCFAKPLGYAGDYEMVNMMLRNPCEGRTLFDKVLNLWFLDQPPVVAHRNRIDYLVDQLMQFTARACGQNKKTRILTVGCGPAQEIQQFLAEQHISNQTDVTLLDFNEETLRYTGAILADLKAKNSRQTTLRYIKKSVHQLLKESGRAAEIPTNAQYDLVYCAGLFDYLSEQVCRRLMDIMYRWVSPGGLLIATNVTTHNPSRGWMEHVTDWHLIYRDARQMRGLTPSAASADSVRVVSEPSGVNVFLEVEKAGYA